MGWDMMGLGDWASLICCSWNAVSWWLECLTPLPSSRHCLSFTTEWIGDLGDHWSQFGDVRRCSAFEPAGSSNNCTASQPVWEAQLALASVGSWSGPVVQMFVWWGKHQVNDGPGKPDQSSTVVEHTGSIESWRLLRQINAILVVQVTPSLHSKPQCGLMILTATIFPMIFSKQHHCLLSTVWCFLLRWWFISPFPPPSKTLDKFFILLDSSIACVPWRPCRGGEAEHPMVHHRFPYDRYSDIFGYVFRRYSGRYIIIYIYIYNIYIYIYSIFWIHLLFIFNMEYRHHRHIAHGTSYQGDQRSKIS